MREVRLVRERERERERERGRERERYIDGSDVTTVELTLAMSFALFLAKNLQIKRVLHFPLPEICTLVSPLLIGAEFTLSVLKNVALFETVRILRKIRTVKWRDRGSKQQNKRSNFQLHRPHRKNECNLYQKLLEIEEEKFLLNFFYTMVQKSKKMTKNSNQGVLP